MIVRLLGTLSTVDDFVHFFRICQPQVVVVDLALLGKVKSGLQRVPDLHKVKLVILGKDGPDNLCQVF
jgi:4-coumarate--CoA ligase